LLLFCDLFSLITCLIANSRHQKVQNKRKKKRRIGINTRKVMVRDIGFVSYCKLYYNVKMNLYVDIVYFNENRLFHFILEVVNYNSQSDWSNKYWPIYFH
jgi:hypothetical protein